MLPAGYLDWAAAAGIHLSPSLALRHTPALGLHCVATAPLPRGHALIRTPLAACYAPLAASRLASDLGAAGQAPLFIAAAALAAALAAAPAGAAHAALLLALPPIHNAARWGAQELPVAARYAEALPALRRHCAQQRLPALEDFVRAASLLLSRGFALPFPGAVEGAPVLAPVLDLLNHSPEPSACVRVTARALECTALRAVRAGEQVTISYGALADAELAWRYGFTLCRPPAAAAEGAGGAAAAAAPAAAGQREPPGRKRRRAAAAEEEGAQELQEHVLLRLTLDNPHNAAQLPWASVFAACGALAALWVPSSVQAAAGSGRQSPLAEVLALLAPLLEAEGETEAGAAVALQARSGAGALRLPAALVEAVTALLLAGEQSGAQRRAAALRALAAAGCGGGSGGGGARGEATLPCPHPLVRAALCAMLSQRLKAYSCTLGQDYAWWAAQCSSGGDVGGSSSSSSSSSRAGAGRRPKAQSGAAAPPAGPQRLALARLVEMGEKEVLVSLLADLA